MAALIVGVAIIAAGVGAGLLLRPAAATPGRTTGTGASSAPATAAGSTHTGAPAALSPPPIVDGAADISAVVAVAPDDGEEAPYERTAPATGTLRLGAAVALADQAVGPAGGSITVAKPGDPLDGLRLDIPAGAFASGRQVTITQRAIESSSFPDLVTPASPLITIDDGGGYADALLTLRIPARIPDGAVAGAFYYDEATGHLEGLPLVAMDATGLTVTTRHFSSLFAAIARGGLPDTVDSGFRPGVDDWQFVNRGSFIEPGGHCSGQAVTAMYYYIERRLATGASPLYGLFDNNGSTRTPDLWLDDSDGYRLASTVQHDTNWNSWAATLFTNSEKTPDRYHRMALRYAMAVTGEPQEMFIYDAAGGNGHAIVAYRVTPTWVMVADPNFPGSTRGIRWDEASQDLRPYTSGTNAVNIAENGVTVYEQLLFAAKSAVANWGQVGQRWADFDGSVVGDGTFPAPVLEVLTGKDAQGSDVWAPLADGYRTNEKKLTVRLTRFGSGSTMSAYRTTSATAVGPPAAKQTIDLDDGANPLGFAIFGMVGTEWQYVDFVRLVVNSGESEDWALADVSVKHTGVSVNQDYTWSYEGDGRGGITTTWKTAFGTPATATLKANWEIPDSLTPGTQVDVSGDLKVTLDFESRAGEFCADLMYQLGPEDGRLIAYGLNTTAADPASVAQPVPADQRLTMFEVSIGCDLTAGTMSSSASGSGTFTVPDRLVPAAGEMPYLLVRFSVSHDFDTLEVTYSYR